MQFHFENEISNQFAVEQYVDQPNGCEWRNKHNEQDKKLLV